MSLTKIGLKLKVRRRPLPNSNKRKNKIGSPWRKYTTSC